MKSADSQRIFSLILVSLLDVPYRVTMSSIKRSHRGLILLQCPKFRMVTKKGAGHVISFCVFS